MSRLAPLLLLGALAACRKPAPPPAQATPEAIGAELATYPQLLLPLTDKTVRDYEVAQSRHGSDVNAAHFQRTYVHGEATKKGAPLAVFVAYASPWNAPKDAPLQPVAILQFLRAFAVDDETSFAMVTTPKGAIIFSREQLPDVIGAARAGGAGSEELPFSVVRGSGR